MGVEDSVLKDELYRIILGEFLRRLDAQMEPSRPGNGAANGAGNGDAHVPGLGEPRLPFEITRKVSDSSGR